MSINKFDTKEYHAITKLFEKLDEDKLFSEIINLILKYPEEICYYYQKSFKTSVYNFVHNFDWDLYNIKYNCYHCESQDMAINMFKFDIIVMLVDRIPHKDYELSKLIKIKVFQNIQDIQSEFKRLAILCDTYYK